MAHARALFLADWCNALFVHFRAEPRQLAPHVPFDLHLRGGDAYVSLVAFTQQHLRFARGGRLASLIASPLAEHKFLNLRTYVRVKGQPAIYFLAEWIPNRLAALIGPRTYGLPYHLGQLRSHLTSRIVRARGKTLKIHHAAAASQLQSSRAGSLDEFLLERYVAFTHLRGVARRFDVAHAPWQQTRIAAQVIDLGLVRTVLPSISREQLIVAHWSPGVTDVRISAPMRVGAEVKVPQPRTTARRTARAEVRC